MRLIVEPQADAYGRLTSAADESHRSYDLDTLLDINDSFLHLEARKKDWSAVDMACCCKYCYKNLVCGDTVLVGMCFNHTLSVPAGMCFNHTLSVAP